MESTVEFLIENVRLHECLWNRTHVFYRDFDKKDNIWEDIARECGMSCGKEAKSYWFKLRNSYRDAMRRRKPEAGSSAQYLGKWKYEEHMKFLLDPSDCKETFYTNDTQENSSKNSLEINNVPVIFPVITKSETICNDDSLSIKSENRKRKGDICYTYEEREMLLEERERHRDELLRRIVETYGQDDALSKFFDSLCDKTRDLPRYLQLRVQREVFDAVSRAEEEALTLNAGMNTYSTVSKTSPKGYEEPSFASQSHYNEHSDFDTKSNRNSVDSNDS